MSDFPDHVLQNRAYWGAISPDWVAPGRRAWSKAEIDWGIWRLPESEVQALGDLAALKEKDVIELGCGTAYFSAWFAKYGANPVGVDITPEQLTTARMFQAEFGIDFPLIECSAEQIPLPDASFDIAFSEYGASIWCDPYKWIPEAGRLLRPGGRLIFLRNSTLATLCTPDAGPAISELCRDYDKIESLSWDGSVEFQLTPGKLIRLLRSAGLAIENFIELMAPPDAEDIRFEYITADWAKRWPSEEIWVASKT